jgi:hypothetical protein
MTLDHIRTLLVCIAPELSDLRCTLPPAGYPIPHDTYAFATLRPDEVLSAHLGIDPATMVTPCVVFAAIPADKDDLIGIALHEGAHLLPRPVFAPDYKPRLPRLPVATAAAMLAAAPNIAGRDPDHGRDFVRIAIHLRHRAASIGIEIPYPAMRCGWEYGLPPTVMLSRWLGDEPERMRHASFAEILAHPAPHAFTRFFEEV